MEEIERLQNNTQDNIGVSVYLMTKIAPIASPPHTYISILSFETGIFPESWKISRTIPLFVAQKIIHPTINQLALATLLP